MSSSSPFLIPVRSAAGADLRSGARVADLAGDQALAAANPARAAEVTAVLNQYLGKQLSQPALQFLQAPSEVSDGWEAYSYCFQLQSSRPLPGVYGEPLVLRIYSSPKGLPRAQREFLIQRSMFERGCAYFGGPFLVMRHVAGETLLRHVVRKPWSLWSCPARMARMQARLHGLPLDGFPALDGCLILRRLDEMQTIIRAYDLEHLLPGLDWLAVHRPEPPAQKCIVHLDYHPLNLIHTATGELVILDWCEADMGDIHADVGTTLALMEYLPAAIAEYGFAMMKSISGVLPSV